MTTKEAIQAMLDGNKCRKTFWEADCFCKFDGNRFIDGLGRVLYSFGDIEWEIYEEPKPKQVVVIEKWLCYDNLSKSYSIAEESNIDGYINDDRAYISKVKLLDTYEVELDDKK